jgi:hypothetical protein
MQTHALEVAHDNYSSSHGSSAQHAGSPAGTHLQNPELPSSENDGLIFRSYEHATAERLKRFWRTLESIDDDDVDEVDQHKGKYVLAIKRALNCKDFLPPLAKKDGSGNMIEMDQEDKASWEKWQKKGQQDFEAHLAKQERRGGPGWSETEYRAREVIDEIIKIHHQGFEVTNTKKTTQQKEDETLKCSARVEEAVRVIKGYGRVRVKILDGDKIPLFCLSPEAYVKVTIAASWNNSGRPWKTKKTSDAVPSQQAAKKNESVARGPGKGKNRKSAKTKGRDPVGTGDGIEQEPSTALSTESRVNDSLPVDTDGEGEDEDAEWEDDDDANNALPTFNNGGLGANRFGYVPDRLSQRESPQDDNTYEVNLGNNMNTTTMSPFYRPIQARPYGTATPDLAARTHPMPAPSALMSPATGFYPSMTTRASYPEPSMYSYSPHGLSTGPGPAMGYLRYPTLYITENTISRQPSAGPPNTQGPRSEVPETPTNKRRRMV